jgi:hypothetical protein
MTLIELLFLLIVIFVGRAVGAWGYHRYGWLGGVVGFAVGSIGIWAFLYVVFAVLGYFLQSIYWGRPSEPACTTGTCHHGDYKYERLGNGHGYRCKCGLLYQKRGRRFLEEKPDGSVQPYMIWKAFRGWFPER